MADDATAPLWVDVTLFNGEPVMRTRLEYLYPVVDKFYVCEQRTTFRGVKKPELYIDTCHDWFVPFLDKVVFVVDESEDACNTAWAVEARARNFCMATLRRDLAATPAAIISVCDCDEIPPADLDRKALLRACADVTCVHMTQRLFGYNLCTEFALAWTKPFFVGGFDIATKLRDGPSFETLRGAPVLHLADNCGWHLTYFMSPADIARKLVSFSHVEYSQPPYTDLSYIKTRIREHKSLFDETTAMTVTALSSFPAPFQALHAMLAESQCGTTG